MYNSYPHHHPHPICSLCSHYISTLCQPIYARPLLVTLNSIVVCHVCCTGWTFQNVCTVQYKLGITVCRCQQHKAPQYLIDCVMPASDIASRQRLRSASRHQLLVPRYQLSSLGRRSFAVAVLGIHCRLTSVRDLMCSDESFGRSLKTFLFAKY